jgi:hypothetical protein
VLTGEKQLSSLNFALPFIVVNKLRQIIYSQNEPTERGRIGGVHCSQSFVVDEIDISHTVILSTCVNCFAQERRVFVALF